MTGRRRRTPEQARAEILAAAEQRLREHGITGLNVVDVAAAAGMRHATVLHHFGNSAGMRRELVAYMTDRLLRDILEALQQQPGVGAPEILRTLFEALSRGGHIKLLAWLSLGGDELNEGASASAHLAERFAELVPVLAARLQGELDPEQ
ncbi:MAG: TetR/AcrR family transcriptional regulator, partial [Pseudomonadales bacterium]